MENSSATKKKCATTCTKSLKHILSKETRQIKVYTILFTLHEIQIQANLNYFCAYQNTIVVWENIEIRIRMEEIENNWLRNCQEEEQSLWEQGLEVFYASFGAVATQAYNYQNIQLNH